MGLTWRNHRRASGGSASVPSARNGNSKKEMCPFHFGGASAAFSVCSKKIEWTFGCHSSLRAYSAGILTSQRGPHVLPIMWRRLRGAAFIIASVTRRKHTISSLSTVKWTSLLSLATRPLDAGSLFVLAQSRREDASLDGRGQQVGTWSSLEACRLLASNGITVEFKGIAGMSTHASYHDWLQS